MSYLITHADHELHRADMLAMLQYEEGEHNAHVIAWLKYLAAQP